MNPNKLINTLLSCAKQLRPAVQASIHKRRLRLSFGKWKNLHVSRIERPSSTFTYMFIRRKAEKFARFSHRVVVTINGKTHRHADIQLSITKLVIQSILRCTPVITRNMGQSPTWGRPRGAQASLDQFLARVKTWGASKPYGPKYSLSKNSIWVGQR